jgi:hypothetical protein
MIVRAAFYSVKRRPFRRCDAPKDARVKAEFALCHYRGYRLGDLADQAQLPSGRQIGQPMDQYPGQRCKKWACGEERV